MEDAGEIFQSGYSTGCPYADVTIMSFGMLKHNTAFGGSVSIVRSDGQLYQDMLEVDKGYEIESSYNYLT